jgi:ABC-type transport system involved in cytochrome c biogenesis permease subunit
MTMAALALSTSPVHEGKLPASLDLTVIRSLIVQHDGRWPPLDTVARDTVESVTGQQFFDGQDPVLLLLAWTFDSDTWMDQPLISIPNDELRRELKLPADQDVFSYAELVSHDHLLALIDRLAHIQGRKPNPLESKVSDINERLVTLQHVFQGRVVRPIPAPDDFNAAWHAIPASTTQGSADLSSVREAWDALGDAFLADEPAAFTSASRALTNTLAALPAAHRPAPERIQAELHYNRLHAFRLGWQLMFVGAFLAALAMLVNHKWLDVLTVLGLVAGFGVLTYGLWLRWQIAGRIPASNMFESLLFLSWGMVAFAIVSTFLLKHRLVPLTASVMGALSLMLADILPLDSFVRPIVPVLRDTVWMSIHVPIIMVSYSVLALGVLFAHVQLVLMAIAPGRRKLVNTVDTLHYWYIHVGSILLFAGIVTGSMWAASSWGRYWGWDPKEVWSLVALLGYLTILHVRIDAEKVPRFAYVIGLVLTAALFIIVMPKLQPLTAGKILGFVGAAVGAVILVVTRGPFATAVKSILCFWLIIMTYVGVNYVLGIGLHSYGFGTGAVVRYMFLLGGLDLGFLALCCLVYLARTGGRRAAADTTITATAG